MVCRRTSSPAGGEQVERRVPGDLRDAEIVGVRRDQAVQVGSAAALQVGQLGAGEAVVERVLDGDRLGVAVEQQVLLGEVEQLVDGGVGRDRSPAATASAGGVGDRPAAVRRATRADTDSGSASTIGSVARISAISVLW